MFVKYKLLNIVSLNKDERYKYDNYLYLLWINQD